jgi:hypothetical protein
VIGAAWKDADATGYARAQPVQPAEVLLARCGDRLDTRQFHSRLLAQFTSNVQCQIAIVRLTEGKSDSDSRKNLEIFKQTTWELNLNFTPGAAKQGWALWPYQSGSIVGSALEGEGDPRQIATDVCTIVAGRGAKIRN